jgi:TetR/AcrR family transcriptional repressor of mexJK operon
MTRKAARPAPEQKPKHPRYTAGQGRPSVRKRLLDAASSEFLSKGFAGSSMDGILRRAGGSKRTLYRHFPDKATLFKAVIEYQASQMDARPGDLANDSRPPDEVLTELGEWIYDVSSQEPRRSLLRMVIAEAQLFPGISEGMYDFGFDAAKGPYVALFRYFESMRDRGLLADADPKMAAELFVHSVLRGVGFLMVPNRTQRERTLWIRQSIKVFLRGVLSEQAAARQTRSPSQQLLDRASA